MAQSLEIYESFELPMAEGAILAGRKTAQEEAFEAGRAEGLTEGALMGRREGLREGRETGFDEGHVKGLEEGRRTALSEGERQKGQALEQLSSCLRAALEQRADAEAHVAAQAALAMRAALAALLPRLAQRGLADEVAALSEELMRDAALGAAVLRVAPAQEAATLAALEAYRRDFGAGAEIEFLSDPSIGPAEARLEWRDGMAAFDGEEASASILARLDAAFEALRKPPAASAAADPASR